MEPDAVMVCANGPFAGLEFGVVAEPSLTRIVSLDVTESTYVETARETVNGVLRITVAVD